jgi:hypothetical protein|tara:strand:+ start:709 stop:1092 length:384 start_codon:yes stop_codon:yes gene_type:complete
MPQITQMTRAHTVYIIAEDDIGATLRTLHLIVVASSSGNIDSFDLRFTNAINDDRITFYFIDCAVVTMPVAFGNDVGRLSDRVVFEPKPKMFIRVGYYLYTTVRCNQKAGVTKPFNFDVSPPSINQR